MVSGKIKILICDDQEVVQIGLTTLLLKVPAFEILGHTTTAQESVKKAKELEPHVVIIDINLPGDGLWACQEISFHVKASKLLVLTSHIDDKLLIDAIRVGIKGYFLKKTPGEELVEIIKKIHQGFYLLDPVITGRVFDYIKRPHHHKSVYRKLSEQEEVILDLLAQGMTNQEIADRIHLAERTVRNYVSKILKKLDLKNRVEAATFITRRRFNQFD